MPQNISNISSLKSLNNQDTLILPGKADQTLYLSLDSSVGAGTFSRSTNAWNPETGIIAPNNLKLHSEFEGGVGDLSTLLNVSIGSLTGFTNAAVFAAGAVQKYFQWGSGILAPVVGEPRVYSCYIQMADLSAPAPTTNTAVGTDVYISQGSFFPTYIGSELVDPTNAIYRVRWASAAGDTSGNVYLNQPANGSGKSFKVSGCMVERVTSSAVTTASTYIKTTSTAVYMPRYVTGKSGQALVIEESSTNVFINNTGTATPTTKTISLTTAGSGKWTCSVIGAGTVTSSAGTATATGYGAASDGSPNTITVTVNGTVTYTVAGASATTRVQVENLAYPTSNIITGATSVSRGSESLIHPTASYFTASQGTVMLWLYLDSRIITSSSSKVAFNLTSPANVDELLIYKSSANTLAYYCGNAAASGTAGTYDITSFAGQWAHIAITWGDGVSSKLYVNGVQRATAGNIAPDTLKTTFAIGSGITGASQWDSGIDQFRVFDRPLTTTEIATYYNRGK